MRCVILIFIIFSASSAYSQKCKKIYEDQLEPNSKLIKCGANFTIEKLPDGHYCLKRYFVETKAMTHKVTFKNKEMKVLDGLFIHQWDDGTTVEKGMYKDGLKVGFWRDDEFQLGKYVERERDSTWVFYKAGDILIRRVNYDSGTEIAVWNIAKDGSASLQSDTVEVVEEMPRFPGCEDSGLEGDELQKCAEVKMVEFIYGKIKYPAKARRKNIQGKAMVRFVVNKSGTIEDIKILNGISNDIQEMVLSIIKKMPNNWSPGKQRGVPVNVLYTLPVVFKLE